MFELSISLLFKFFFFQLQEFKTKIQESQVDLQRQLQAAKKVRFMHVFYSEEMDWAGKGMVLRP